MALTLSIDQEGFIDDPDPAAISKELTALEEDQFAILSRSDSVFLQTDIGPDGELVLQYRDEPNPISGNPPELFEATNPPSSREELIKVFCEYAAGDDGWKDRFNWSLMEMLEIDYTIVVATEKDQIGKFDPHGSELRTDFPEVPADSVIALCAIAMKSSTQKICNDFKVSEGQDARWLSVPDAVLNALVEFPDESLENVTKKWYALDSFPSDTYQFEDALDMAIGLFDLAFEASEQGIALAFCEV
jgi:hypothetical protein